MSLIVHPSRGAPATPELKKFKFALQANREKKLEAKLRVKTSLVFILTPELKKIKFVNLTLFGK
jgi:hypothetical protein